MALLGLGLIPASYFMEIKIYNYIYHKNFKVLDIIADVIVISFFCIIPFFMIQNGIKYPKAAIINMFMVDILINLS